MTHLDAVLNRAAKRLWVQRFLRWLGGCLLASAGLAAIWALLAPALLWPEPWWGYLALAGAAVVMALIGSLVHRPTPREVALLVDDRLGLKDRVHTALFARDHGDHPFAQQVIADAEQATKSARLNEAMPITLTKRWGWVPVAVAVAAVLAVFIPAEFDPFRLRQQHRLAQQQDEAIENAEVQLEEAFKQIKAFDEQRVDSDLSQEPGDLMKDLKATLSQRDLSTPELQRQAAAELSELNERLEQATQQQQDQLNQFQTAMSRLETERRGPADKFTEAMRRSDFEAARQALADMAVQIENGNLSETEKQNLSNQFNQLSQQLGQMAQQHQQQAAAAQQQAQQTMQNAGLNQQQINQLQQQGFNQQAVQQALQQQGMSQQQAQQMAQQIAQQMQQAQQNQQNGQSQQNMSQAMQQMQQQMQNGQNPSQASQQLQQQLGQMQQMQQQLSQMQAAQQQMQQAMSAMAQQGQGGQKPGQGGGKGGKQWGTGDGGNPLGQESAPTNVNSTAVNDTRQGMGPVIASWQEYGPMSAGEANVQFNQAVTEARTDAERAVTDDRAPRRYHRAIRDYFGNLPAEGGSDTAGESHETQE